MLATSAKRLLRALCLPALLLTAAPAHAADQFQLDQRYGSIAFSTDHFGTFASNGNFQRFTGRLAVDRDHPENTTVEVAVEAGSAAIAWQDGTSMLRGPDFFDAANHKTIRFTSVSIAGVDPTHFRINGNLEIRGITRPLTLDARLERRWVDAGAGSEIADFTVTGAMSRADYGMVAHKAMISDKVRLTITARVALPVKAQ